MNKEKADVKKPTKVGPQGGSLNRFFFPSAISFIHMAVWDKQVSGKPPAGALRAHVCGVFLPLTSLLHGRPREERKVGEAGTRPGTQEAAIRELCPLFANDSFSSRPLSLRRDLGPRTRAWRHGNGLEAAAERSIEDRFPMGRQCAG